MNRLRRILQLLGRPFGTRSAARPDPEASAQEQAEGPVAAADMDRLLANPPPGLVSFLRERRKGYSPGSLSRDRLDRTIHDLERRRD